MNSAPTHFHQEIDFSADTWHQSLAQAIRNPIDLLEAVGLSADDFPPFLAAAQQFPLLAPRSYVDRIRRGDRSDPLLLQILPTATEVIPAEGFTTDSVGDQAARKQPGFLHKYEGRALLITTGACAVNCRYCFRRHYPYQDDPRRLQDWEPTFQQIEQDVSLREILLSGGDPLMLTDLRLDQIISRLAQIPHLERLRIHSRLPIVLPDRVTDTLLTLLTKSRLSPIVVVHANHPNEIVGDCESALMRLVRSGVPTLNQSVLLKGINDSVETLKRLSERLIRTGVIPYYLHQLDRVQGAAHFEVPIERGREIVRELRRLLPGYAVPKYVQELAGEPSKTPLD